MKRFNCTMLALALLAPAVMADEEKNSLRDGAWAIQFAIEDNFQVGPFDGNISLKRHFSDRSAVRLGIDADYSFTENNTPTTDSDRTRTFVELEALYMRYLATDRDIVVYLGAGPSGYYDRFDDEAVIKTNAARRKVDENTWSLGGTGAVGAEWFVRTRLSIHAEYFGRLAYRWTSGERTDTTEDSVSRVEYSGGGWSITSAATRFGLSVYF